MDITNGINHTDKTCFLLMKATKQYQHELQTIYQQFRFQYRVPYTKIGKMQ